VKIGGRLYMYLSLWALVNSNLEYSGEQNDTFVTERTKWLSGVASLKFTSCLPTKTCTKCICSFQISWSLFTFFLSLYHSTNLPVIAMGMFICFLHMGVFFQLECLFLKWFSLQCAHGKKKKKKLMVCRNIKGSTEEEEMHAISIYK
jgi:hypothetical protein